MKKHKPYILYFTIIFSFILFLSGCSTKQDTAPQKSTSLLEKIEQKKELRVATSGTLYPTSYYNDKNDLTGYDVEVVKEIAKRWNVKTVFEEYNVEGALTALQQNRVDLAANDFSITPEREKYFSLSSPIKYSFGSLLVRSKDQSGIHNLSDLSGKKAAGESGTIYMQLAEKLGADPLYYDNASNDQYLNDLVNGRSDTILNDYYLQKIALSAFPDLPIEILDGVYYKESQSGILIPKNQPALEKKINETLKEMKKDGTLKKISQEFFQADVTVKPENITIQEIDQ